MPRTLLCWVEMRDVIVVGKDGNGLLAAGATLRTDEEGCG